MSDERKLTAEQIVAFAYEGMLIGWEQRSELKRLIDAARAALDAERGGDV